MAKYDKKIPKNDEVCLCGRHKGVGILSPVDRARVYKWFKERQPSLYTAEKRQYLESFEVYHGIVKAEIVREKS